MAVKPEMPEVNALYLVSYTFDMMGESAISYAELDAWQRTIGVTLQPWESQTIRRLSIEYKNESDRARKNDCPSPYLPDDHVIDKLAVADNMRASILKLSKM